MGRRPCGTLAQPRRRGLLALWGGAESSNARRLPAIRARARRLPPAPDGRGAVRAGDVGAGEDLVGLDAALFDHFSVLRIVAPNHRCELFGTGDERLQA